MSNATGVTLSWKGVFAIMGIMISLGGAAIGYGQLQGQVNEIESRTKNMVQLETTVAVLNAKLEHIEQQNARIIQQNERILESIGRRQ